MKKAIIIGAGPAGLTAAYELLTRTDIQPIIIEKSEAFGGISRTINYKGNRIDIGGHRFFSKSKRVMEWWFNILPAQHDYAADPSDPSIHAINPEKTDDVLLVRNRLSRILFLRKLFDYPITISVTTIKNLGIWRIIKIFFSYVRTRIQPIKKEKSLEDFFINRFGRQLYATFFRDYSFKVWGVPCNAIKPEWGAQRIKGLSIMGAVVNAVSSLMTSKKERLKKQVETTLISRFYYPKFGPGHMWERVAQLIEERGGIIIKNHDVERVFVENGRATEVYARDAQTGIEQRFEADYVFSSMPVSELIASMHDAPPADVKRVAKGLAYRDFITVGLLLKKFEIKGYGGNVQDNWIYIQENDVKIGRLQIFNNWSPYMVANPDHVWVGLEYFANVGDELWSLTDEQLKELGVREMCKLGLIEDADVLDQTVIRQPKAYPAYFGTYEEFDVVKDWLGTVKNLFPVGRNGMHKYNNQDHSMLSSMTAVDLIVEQKTDDHEALWNVNVEKEYHEGKSNA